MAVFWETFFANRTAIEEQYRAVRWRENSGLAPEELRAMADGAMEAETDKALKKARAFACVLDHAQLAVEPAELFQDHIRHDFILQKQRREWEKEAYEGPLRAVAEKAARMRALGAGTANSDFGHTVPDWYDVLALGLPGLLARLREYDDGSAFYRAGTLVYEAAIRYVRRLAGECRRAARACAPCDAERLRYCAEDLEALAQHEPRTLHQAGPAVFPLLLGGFAGRPAHARAGKGIVAGFFPEISCAHGRFPLWRADVSGRRVAQRRVRGERVDGFDPGSLRRTEPRQSQISHSRFGEHARPLPAPRAGLRAPGEFQLRFYLRRVRDPHDAKGGRYAGRSARIRAHRLL